MEEALVLIFLGMAAVIGMVLRKARSKAEELAPPYVIFPVSGVFQELNDLRLPHFLIGHFAPFARADERGLLILGSSDFRFFHHAEIRFVGVEYMELRSVFSDAYFRAASAEEEEALRERVGFGGAVYCIIESRNVADARKRFVVAASVEIKLKTVVYRDGASNDGG